MHVSFKYTAIVKEYYRWNGIKLINYHKHGTERSRRSFYNKINQNIESCVRLGDQNTEWFKCTSGVRQGNNLSPTLFALIIIGLADEV